MPTDNVYRHRPLRREDDIRLMRITPGCFESENIHCKIRHYCRTAKNLSSSMRYRTFWAIRLELRLSTLVHGSCMSRKTVSLQYKDYDTKASQD